MYHELFELKEPPFQLAPDPHFMFESPQHARAKAYMESTVLLGDGFVVLTGEIGCGKTTLIESFVSRLPDDMLVVQLTQTQVSPVEFLQTLLVELGFEPFQMRKVELLTRLKKFLMERYTNGQKVLLIIDEAQNLSRKVLEEVRLLSGIETQKEKVLRIILVGQPELAQKLDSQRLEQLAQRVRLRFHLSGLSEPDTRAYIQHRLDVAGAGGRSIFSDEALDLIFRYTGGVPRLINTLCDTAMLCAFSEDKPAVTARFVETAVRDLQWVPYADRAPQEELIPGAGSDRLARLEAGRAKLDTALGEFRPPAAADASSGHGNRHRAADAPLARLDVLRRGKRVSSLDLFKGRITIGRAPGADLFIDSSYMSLRHAQIITGEEKSTLEDLNSTNGVRVGGKLVPTARLTDGDLIRLGEHSLLYRDLRSRLDTKPEPQGDDRRAEESQAGRRVTRGAKLVSPEDAEQKGKRWRRKHPRQKPWRK